MRFAKVFKAFRSGGKSFFCFSLNITQPPSTFSPFSPVWKRIAFSYYFRKSDDFTSYISFLTVFYF